MAVNQVSLFFYTPRWQQRLTDASHGLTDEGKPVQLAGAVRNPLDEGPAVESDSVRKWLVEQGFSVAEWGEGHIFQRGQIRSIFGLEKGIEIHVGDKTGEVADLYCRFTLPKRALPQLEEWTRLVTDLCARFRLRLGADGATPCSEEEFQTAVRRSRNCQDFARAYGWGEELG
jgi:hypothetical protein